MFLITPLFKFYFLCIDGAQEFDRRCRDEGEGTRRCSRLRYKVNILIFIYLYFYLIEFRGLGLRLFWHYLPVLIFMLLLWEGRPHLICPCDKGGKLGHPCPVYTFLVMSILLFLSNYLLDFNKTLWELSIQRCTWVPFGNFQHRVMTPN